ncbi:hypothetical protein QQ045_033239 [Rhodiola kirilowii]
MSLFLPIQSSADHFLFYACYVALGVGNGCEFTDEASAGTFDENAYECSPTVFLVGILNIYCPLETGLPDKALQLFDLLVADCVIAADEIIMSKVDIVTPAVCKYTEACLLKYKVIANTNYYNHPWLLKEQLIGDDQSVTATVGHRAEK